MQLFLNHYSTFSQLFLTDYSIISLISRRQLFLTAQKKSVRNSCTVSEEQLYSKLKKVGEEQLQCTCAITNPFRKNLYGTYI